MARKKIPLWLLALAAAGAWYWYKKQQATKAAALAAANPGGLTQVQLNMVP